MQRIHIFIYCFILIVCWTSNSVCPSVHAVAEVVILDNHSSYKDTAGYLHVVGEVENTGNKSVRFVQIMGTFYDNQSNIILQDTTFAMLEILPPETRSPFDLFLVSSSPDIISRIDHYELNIDFTETNQTLTRTLLLLSKYNYISDVTGYLYIVGEIQNNGTETSTFTQAFATCYDINGTVVVVGSAFANPYGLEYGQRALFQILILNKEQNILVANYDIQLKSDQAILIPEFPNITIFSILIFLITIIFLRQKSIRQEIIH
ncbi:MAG: FxLYD domain-containing protein [Candidatus Bathyarchaeia archaeon]